VHLEYQEASNSINRSSSKVMMKRSRRVLILLAVLALVVGLGFMVASGFQIYQMGVNSGSAHLSELTSDLIVKEVL
jgi:hypothetical protein